MVARLRCTRLLSVTGNWVTDEAMTSAFFRFRHLAANKTWHGVVENTLKGRASHMYPVTFEHLKGVVLRTHRMSGNQLLSNRRSRGSRSTCYDRCPREWLAIPSALMSRSSFVSSPLTGSCGVNYLGAG
jgi:hypothetical protein